MITAGIVGATGYTGVELLRLLAGHSEVAVKLVTSRELAGAPVAGRFPNLRGRYDLAFSAPDSAALGECDVVFYATPHAVAMKFAARVLAGGARVIDLSADFRIRDIACWERWYGLRHESPELVAEAVYGLPEVNREAIRTARLIAVPGCYPTAIQLALLPLLENRLIDARRIIADAKSGVSGAGRKAAAEYLLCEASESISAYGLAGHRHHPEIVQGLARANGGNPVGLTFVPHLTPMIRGILATCYAPLRDSGATDAGLLQSVFEQRYAGEPFVQVLPRGTLPATREVRGSNVCELSVNHDEAQSMAIVLAAEDNLVKGAAGQAIQCMNVMFGWDESAGLTGIGLLP